MAQMAMRESEFTTADVRRITKELADANPTDPDGYVRVPLQPPIPAVALARYADFAPGDQLTITLGQELYSPVKYFTFTVGPFAATVTVRPDESGADAAMRCYRVLLELNESEFNIAWQRHRDRIAKMPKQRD